MGAKRKYAPAGCASTVERLAEQNWGIVGIAKYFNVSRETFRRWCDEDQAIQEAVEVGRETAKQALIAIITEDAKNRRQANTNCMFLLKALHGMRENDSPNTKVNVGIATAPTNVLVIKDHGSDESWQAKVIAQQRALAAHGASVDTSPKQLEGSTEAVVEEFEPSVFEPETEAVPSPLSLGFGPPSWKPRS